MKKRLLRFVGAAFFCGVVSGIPAQTALDLEALAARDVKAPATKLVIEPPTTPPALRDPDLEWVEETLAGMTLDEKIGQMIMPQYLSGSASSNLSTYHVGGFIFLRTGKDTILSATNSLQGESDVPLLFSIDCEAGAGARVNEGTIFPMNMGLAATRNTDYAYQQGIITARECRALGIHVGFGPVLDVNTEPVNPIIGIRSFSDDPALVAKMAEAYVRGAESAGMLTTFKHFPGHGATEGDSHSGIQTVNITCDELQAMHVAPYAALVDKGLGSFFMSAHVWYPCLDPGVNPVPGTISQAAQTGIAREQLGFDGVLISDAFNMAGLSDVAGTYGGVKLGVQAGLDIILMPTSVADAFNGIRDAVLAEEITEARINQSVRRILKAKSRVGLPESAIVPVDVANNTVSHPDHWTVAEVTAADALAKGVAEPGIVPFDSTQSVYVLSLNVTSGIFYLYGDEYFVNTLESLHPNVTVETVSTTVGASTRTQLVNAAKTYDRVVVISRNWKPTNFSGQDQLVEQLLDAGVHVVYISFGSPYHILQHPRLQTYYCGFSSHYGTQQQAARMLMGTGSAPGKWPVDLFEQPVDPSWVVY
jgi:beta-N-acetylhexosaminidase